MYETEYTVFVIAWVIVILAYLEWCERNQEKRALNPVDALMYWFGIGFGVTAWLTWVNGYVQATLGNMALAVMFFIVIPVTLRLSSQSSTPTAKVRIDD